MAPSTDPQPRGQTTSTRRRRQNPVSCRFCREKKLRCDRQSPCSNCSSRGVFCSNEPKSQPRAASSDAADNAVLLDRLKHLEEIVRNQQTRPAFADDRLPDAPIASASPWQYPISPITSHVKHAPDQNGDTAPHETSVSEYAEAVQSLEGTGLRRDPWLRKDAVNTEVRVATVHHIVLLHSEPDLREMLSRKSTSFCTLPSKEEAVLLLDYYVDRLEDFQHVLHIPTVQEHLDACYTNLARGQPVNVSVLVVLLSIFASASILMSHHAGDNPPPFSRSDSTRISAYWAGFALDIIKDHHSRPCDRLEDVQATVLLATLLLNVEGFSARVHWFLTVLVSKARDLQLHKIDAPGSWASQKTRDKEIRRRVWWHIVTIDWILSASGGPQEGTYFVQPRHMVVNIPRNVDDRDLIYTNPPLDRPLSEPTAMSYDIQRLKLGDLCRAMVDLIPLSVTDTSSVDYQQVIALDHRFDVFLQELPSFLRNDEQSIQQSEQVVARYPQMRIQRQMLSMLSKTKRCKLHQPFLIRGSVERGYSYSRTMSLKAARAVLEERRSIEPFDTNRNPVDRYKLSTYVTYHTFMATIVLVMDLCFNNNSSSNNNVDHDDETRVTKAEVMEACRNLHQDRSGPGLGTAYLASLMEVLRKYKVKLQPPGTEHSRNNTTSQPVNTTIIPSQRSALHAQPPLYTFPSATENLNYVASISAPPIPPLQRHMMTSSNNDTNAALSYDLNSSSKFFDTNLPLKHSGTGGSAMSADPQGCFADFDDIWNDYVELGPSLDVLQWDSLLSDLGPGMA
ncbi:hypothetical protein H2200_000823 [Cladophialophora chaetospira]|uniref:Zn(2)-C6 fungal-type domain-containing protein n=1 Tax=Cladophialophora chaetospira TaxID=386627 RepID=A0AA38XPA0_9EURO|nr:hypothetical protein H2200_000823 [Cladophialophora chaetospira]